MFIIIGTSYQAVIIHVAADKNGNGSKSIIKLEKCR